MWHDHPFSQRNRTVEATVKVGSGVNREMRGVGVGVDKF